MDSRYLHSFREVAKWQSFTRAAEVLGYAQSSVTAQIQNLEAEFGVVLFERWGRKVRLTQAGQTVLGLANEVLALIDEAKDQLSEQGDLVGTLSIGTVESLAAFYLPPLLQTLRREHPQLKLMLHPGVCHDLRQGVKEGAYDCAVILDVLQDAAELVTVNLGEEELVVVASPDHRLNGQKGLELDDFVGESWIFTELGCSYRILMEDVLEGANVSIDSTLEFGSLEAIKQCVAYGLGIALLPRIAVMEEVEKGKLAILSFSHPQVRVYRQLVYHKKKWIPRAQRRFLQLLLTENGSNQLALG